MPTNKTQKKVTLTNRDHVFELIAAEAKLQRETVRLIPSENYSSPAVHEALGSVLSHKYAEGYPSHRYYQGNQAVDQVEELCRQRALKLFSLKPTEWGVNVQPYSGSPANLAIYNAVLKPGEAIMAMYLPDGGHLSHGWQFKGFKTFVRKIWPATHYHVDPKTETFDYDAILAQAKQDKPKMLVSGGTAYAREIDHAKMGQIAHAVGAYYLADVSHEAGLIAGRVNGSPFPHADFVMMTTHKTLRGPRGAMIFARRQNQVNTTDIAVQDLAHLVDRSIFPGMQGGPHLHTISALAVALAEADQPAFRQYAKQILKNTQTMATVLSKAGYRVVSGGTDKHLLLLDLRGSSTQAWVAAWALEQAGIILNYNTVPNETGSPLYPSGLRLGAPIITTRGMKTVEAKQIATWIAEVIAYASKWQLPTETKARQAFRKQFLDEVTTDAWLKKMYREVTSFAKKYPLFSWE